MPGCDLRLAYFFSSFLLSLFLGGLLAACGAKTGVFVAPPRDASADTDGADRDVPADTDAEPDAAQCVDPATCQDGNACNGVEQCTGGRCVLSPPPSCDDFTDCTADSCASIDSFVHVCVNAIIDRDGDGHIVPSCGGDDCDDADPTVFGGAPELCDYQDNDCDLEVDEEVAYLGLGRSAQNISPGFTSAQRPSVLYDGTDFDVVYDTWPSPVSQVSYVAVSVDAASVTAPRQVTFSTVLSSSPDLKWTGSEYGLFTHFHLRMIASNGAIALSRLSAAGAIVADARDFTSDMPDSDDPSAAWDGSAWGVAYVVNPSFGSHAIRFLRASADAGVLTADWQLSAGDSTIFKPSAVWTGAFFAVAFVEAGALHVAQIDPTGSFVTSNATVAASGGGTPSLVWTGADLAVAWSSGPSGGPLHFARLDAAGARIGPVADLTGASLEVGHLPGADLRWAVLDHVKAERVTLTKGKLSGITATTKAEFPGAYLDRADLQGATLHGVVLKAASLRGIDARGATLEAVDLEVAQMNAADDGTATRLAGAWLTNSNMTNIDVSGVDLRDVHGLTSAQRAAARSDASTRWPSDLG